MTDALEMRDRYTYKTYRQEWRVNSVEVDQYDRNPRVYATKSFPTREEAEAHRVEIAKPHTHVEGRWVPNDATHSYVDCYVQFTEVLSEKSIQTSDIDALDALKACVEQMSNDHPGSDTYWQAVEKAESVISNSKAVVRASCQARVEELERENKELRDTITDCQAIARSALAQAGK